VFTGITDPFCIFLLYFLTEKERKINNNKYI
jgi:hypothetical protein